MAAKKCHKPFFFSFFLSSLLKRFVPVFPKLFVPLFPKIFCLCSPVPQLKLAMFPCSPKPLGNPRYYQTGTRGVIVVRKLFGNIFLRFYLLTSCSQQPCASFILQIVSEHLEWLVICFGTPGITIDSCNSRILLCVFTSPCDCHK